MSFDENDPIFLDICQQLDAFCKRIEEKVDNDLQQLKARKENTEIEEKLAEEKKKHAELVRQLEEVSNRTTELDRLCAQIPGQLTISDNDQNKLDQAKLCYEIAKELTGVRFDYSAPPNVCKGYLKSEARKLLQPFNLEGDTQETLWRLAESVAAPEWGLADKENLPPKHTFHKN